MGKTASDLKKDGWPPDEMQKYNPWRAAELYTKDPNAVARRGRAMEISREAARILKKKYGATRVVLLAPLRGVHCLLQPQILTCVSRGYQKVFSLRRKLRLRRWRRVLGWILLKQRNVPLSFLEKLKMKESTYEGRPTTGGEENKGRTCRGEDGLIPRGARLAQIC